MVDLRLFPILYDPSEAPACSNPIRSSRVSRSRFFDFDLDRQNLDNHGKILSRPTSQMLYEFLRGSGEYYKAFPGDGSVVVEPTSNPNSYTICG